jgi:hypothetical protein
MGRIFESVEDQRYYRQRIEQMLREGSADDALNQVRDDLDRLAAEMQSPLIDAALALDPDAIVLPGWDRLWTRLAKLDQPGNPITAVEFDFSWPGHTGIEPDADGLLEPHIETTYYTDAPAPFSSAERDTLLDGYSSYGTEWQGRFEDIDALVKTRGLGTLYGARELAGDLREADNAAGDAWLVASCHAAVCLHLAVRAHVERYGLPRPLAVLVGSNEDFPFFDAPVFAAPESAPFVREQAPQDAPAVEDEAAPAADAGEAGEHKASLANLGKRTEVMAETTPDPNASPSGTSLRRTLADSSSDFAAVNDDEPRRGLFARLLGR